MKRILIASSLVALATVAAVPAAQAHGVQVGVSLGFAAPGAFGRVDIGRFPAPVLVSRTPVVVGAPLAVREPVYLWVPYEQRMRWNDYCASYGACGLPVYFVEDGWYRDHVIRYAPRPVVYHGYYGGGYYGSGYYGSGYYGNGYYGNGYYGGYRGGYPDGGYWRDRDGRGDRWGHDRDDEHDHDRYRDRDHDDDHDGRPGDGGDRWQRGPGRGY